MELKYNLTRGDYGRGLRLHEGRLKGAGAVFRLAFSLFFLVSAVCAGVVLVMLAVVGLAGGWTEAFGVATGAVLAILAASLIPLALFSPRFRAWASLRQSAAGPDFFGPCTLRLASGGVALSRAGGDAVAPYAALTEVWEKREYCFLYNKAGLWCVLPPCAFESGAQRREFVSLVRAALAGEGPPAEESAGPLPPADLRLEYAWTREGLLEILTVANRAYARTRLFWRPARVAVTALGGLVLLMGLLSLVGAALDLSGEGVRGLVNGVALAVIGLSLAGNLILLSPPMVRLLVSRQLARGKLDELLRGGQTELFWEGGMVSLCGGGREDVRWAQIAQVHSGDGGLFLFRRDNKLHVFPPHAFRDRQEQARAAEYVREHMAKSAG